MEAEETTERGTAPRAVSRRSKRSVNGVQRSTLCVQLTSEERALLEAKAANCGQSMSRVLVSSTLRPATSDVVNPAEVDRLNDELMIYRRQLIGVTANLNQLAHHANTTQDFPTQAHDVLLQVRTALLDIQDLIESIKR
jgi:Bacterial mobilisation protein (MobC).